MSESESFIEEVSDEVRRDNLFKLFKKYGWVLALVVIALVGGTAYNEWRKAAQQATAEHNGDVMQAAIDAKDPAALSALADSGSNTAAIARLQQAGLLVATHDTPAALEVLRKVVNDPTASAVYTDLALLKIIMLDGPNMAENERNNAYERLVQPDSPYRLLALEQRAMQYVHDGKPEAAKKDLDLIIAGQAVPPTLRTRAQQLVVSLGGDATTGQTSAGQ